MSIMRVAVIAVLACVRSHVGYAETRPDFSGNWVLSKAKSKQRDPRQFKRQTMEVSQHDPDLNVDIRDQQPDGHEFRAYLNLKTDGTPAVAILGSPQRAVIRWKGSSMVIRWNLDGTAVSSSGRSGDKVRPPRSPGPGLFLRMATTRSMTYTFTAMSPVISSSGGFSREWANGSS